MLEEESVNWGHQSQSILQYVMPTTLIGFRLLKDLRGIFDSTITLFMNKFGSFVMNEIYEDLILAMLKNPQGDSFTKIHIWRRPLVLRYLSAVLTAREGAQISRFPVFMATPQRPLGHIPPNCSVCKVPIRMSCSICENSVKVVI